MTALHADPQIRWSHGERRIRRRGHWIALAAALAMSAGLHAAAFIALAGRGGASLAPPLTVEMASIDSLAAAPSGGALAPVAPLDMRPAAGSPGAAMAPPPDPPFAAIAPAPTMLDGPRIPAMPSVVPPPAPRQAEMPSASLSLAAPAMVPASSALPRQEFLSIGPSVGRPPGAPPPPGLPAAGALVPLAPPGPPAQAVTQATASSSAVPGETASLPAPNRPARAGEPRPAARAPVGDAVASLPAAAASSGADAGSGAARVSTGVSDLADMDAVPLPGNAAPPYPLVARRAQREGRALVRVLVARDGSGSDVRLAESSGTAALDMAALEAVRTWRFSPARRAGEATEDVILVPVTFRLTQ